MIHQLVSSFYEVQTREFILEAKELLKLCKSLARVYAQRTSKLLWVVSKDMERDVSMSATEAQAHRIVDLIADRDRDRKERDFLCLWITRINVIICGVGIS
ncbi:hypothetical protein ERO13_D01G169088v2 [Gossypium hirsutum]|nr:hypothetical protein ERO13_D01G169088v2 [Gossypium hirsutum]